MPAQSNPQSPTPNSQSRRVSGYLHSFRQPNSDNYKPGTTLEMVWRLYSFDRRMRLVAADALARIEIALRTLIVETHTVAQKGDFFEKASVSGLDGVGLKSHQRFGAVIPATRHGRTSDFA